MNIWGLIYSMNEYNNFIYQCSRMINGGWGGEGKGIIHITSVAACGLPWYYNTTILLLTTYYIYNNAVIIGMAFACVAMFAATSYNVPESPSSYTPAQMPSMGNTPYSNRLASQSGTVIYSSEHGGKGTMIYACKVFILALLVHSHRLHYFSTFMGSVVLPTSMGNDRVRGRGWELVWCFMKFLSSICFIF